MARKIKAADPDAVVLFITAYADTEKAVRAIKAGATDFIPKPWEKEKLLATLSAALKLRESRTEINTLKQRVEALGSPDDTGFEIIGESDVMQELFATIAKLKDTDANILILGENGTGKDLIARALYHHSPRCNQVLSVSILGVSRNNYLKANCSDMKKELSRMHGAISPDVWKWLPAGPCFWMKSVI